MNGTATGAALATIFLLLILSAAPAGDANAQGWNEDDIPNPDCGGFLEPACGVLERGVFERYWLSFSLQKSPGCDIGLVKRLTEDECIHPDAGGRRTHDADDFDLTWTGWALKQQERLAYAEPFNWVSRIGTHNSFSSELGGNPGLIEDFFLANQYYSITDQLRFGVRRMELDLHWIEWVDVTTGNDFTGLRVCHGKSAAENHLGCSITSRPFYSVIKELRDFLDENPSAFLFIELVDESEEHYNEISGPIEYFLGDRVLRTDHIVDDFWNTEQRAPSKREIDRKSAGRQIMFLSSPGGPTGDESLGGLIWRDTRIGGGDAVKMTFAEDLRFLDNGNPYGECLIGDDVVTPIFGDTVDNTNGRFRRVYEARSRLDPLADDVGFLNAEFRPQRPDLQRLVRDVVRCNLTPAFDYLLAQERTDVLAPGIKDYDPCNGGADCGEPDERLKEAVWSWKENDFGHGIGERSAIFDPLDGRWSSRERFEKHHFACAVGRYPSQDPGDWVDKAGQEWRITQAVGTWEEGFDLCLREYGGVPIDLRTWFYISSFPDVPLVPLVFSVPVNGWQNEQLRRAWANAALAGEIVPNRKVWLNYYEDLSGEWVQGVAPRASVQALRVEVIEVDDQGNEIATPVGIQSIPEGSRVRFTLDHLFNPLGFTPAEMELDWRVSPGITPDPDIYIPTDAVEGAAIEWLFDPDRVDTLWNIDLLLAGPGELITNAVLDNFHVNFSLNNVAPTISAPDALYLEAGDITDSGIMANSFYIVDVGNDFPYTCTIDYGLGDGPFTVTSATDESGSFHRCFNGSEFGRMPLYQVYPEGEFVVTITVQDSHGAASQRSFPVVNRRTQFPPYFLPGCDDSLYRVDIDKGFACNAFFADPNEDDVLTARIDWGDGSPIEELAVWDPLGNKRYAVILDHQYAQEGTYDVELVVSDDGIDPLEARKSWQVQVRPRIVDLDPLDLLSGNDASEVGPVFGGVSGNEDRLATKQFFILDPDPKVTSWTVWVNWDPSVTSRIGVVKSYVVHREPGLDDSAPVPFTVSHTYDDGGEYLVSIRAFTRTPNASGSSKLGYFPASVPFDNEAPVIEAIDDVVLVEGGTVSLPGVAFADANPSDPWSGTVSWGDGTSEVLDVDRDAKTFDLVHTYDQSRATPYEVRVTLGDGIATTATMFNVMVGNAAPVVGPIAGGTLAEGGAFTSGGTFTDPGADSWTATVDYGNGAGARPLVLNADRSFTLSHVYGDDGVYALTVTVTDGDGGTGQTSTSVVVENVAPTLDTTGNASENEGAPYILGVGVVTDPGADTVSSCTVRWGDGDSSDCTPGSALAHTYADGGNSYRIDVDLADEDGDHTSVASRDVVVHNVAPVVTLGADVIVFENDLYTLDGSAFVDPSVVDSHTAVVDWGDGSSGDGAVDPDSSTVSGAHAYAAPGRYTVTVTVEDKDGGAGTDTAEVTVLAGNFRTCVSADDPRGRLEVGRGSTVHCSVHGEGAVTVERQASVHGDVTARKQSVEIDRHSTVTGGVVSGGHVRIDRDARVFGDVTSGDDVQLSRNSFAGGSVTAARRVRVERGAEVAGAITEHADVAPLPAPTRVHVHVAAGGSHVRVKRNHTMDLPPGSYGRLVLERRARIVLTSGDYAFESIDTDADAKMVFELDGASVVVNVRGNVRVGRNMDMTVSGADATAILFRVGGARVDFDRGGSLVGTIVAPQARINVDQDTRLTGALHGDRIKMDEVSVTAAPALDLLTERFLP